MLSDKPSDKSFEIKQLLGACYFEQLMLSPCSYLPLKERNHGQSNAHAHKSCSPTSWSIEFERYTSKPMNKLCHNNFWNAMNAQHPFDEKLDLARMKYDNMNQMIGLEEIFVLPSSKLFAGSSKLRECFLLGKGNNMNMNHEGTNEQNKIKDYWNYHVHPSSVLSSMFLGKQKLGTTFS